MLKVVLRKLPVNMFFVRLIVCSTVLQVTSGRLAMPRHNSPPYEHDVFAYETATAHQHRSMAINDLQKLQYNLYNWELCTYSYVNESYTPMNNLVPSNTVFLVEYPTYKLDNSSDTCRAKTITRTGTINPGPHTVFFSLKNIAAYDYEDDWETGICSNSTSESQDQRLADAEEQHLIFTNATFLDTLYYEMDGRIAELVFLYDTSEYHLRACADNRTDEEYWKLIDPSDEGDICDAEPFQAIEGLDVYPILGWYGVDIREWVDGETHTYEFGSLSDCMTAKYILTAKAEIESASPSMRRLLLHGGGAPFWVCVVASFWFLLLS